VKLVDLNILLYAVNRDAKQHRTILGWWEQALNGDESIGLPWVVLLGFLRLTTNPRVFTSPLTAAEAMARVDEWLALDVVVVPTEKPDHWQVFRELVTTSGTAGNLTTDAHLAALAISHDAVLASCDHDFARFGGLRRENPLGRRAS
jgi:toxin-antitoxin system PIN domain toxin